MNTCKKKIPNNEEGYFAFMYKIITQYIKCIFIIGGILMLIYIRKGISSEITMGKLIAYILLASLVFVMISLADNFAYSNLIIGLGIYFGFEVLRFSA